MRQVLVYSLKVWLTTVVFSPVITYVCGLVYLGLPFSTMWTTTYYYIPLAIGVGFVISLLPAIIFYLLGRILVSRGTLDHITKLLMSLLSIVLILAPFIVMMCNGILFKFFQHFMLNMIICGCYLIVGFVSCWSYRLSSGFNKMNSTDL
jgi:hypothetical protein